MTYPRPLYIYFKKPHRSCQPLLTTTTTILTAAHPLSDRLVMRCGSNLAWSGAPCSVLTMRSIKVINITDRHEMTGKDQNQSEGKVASDLLTHIYSPQSQFDQYSIIYDSVVFNLQSDISLLISFDFHYICFNGLRHRHIRYLYRFLSISIIYVAVVCQRYLAVLRHLAIRE
jgi:hypothetical protein